MYLSKNVIEIQLKLTCSIPSFGHMPSTTPPTACVYRFITLLYYLHAASRHLRFKMSLHFSNNTSWFPNKSSILPFSVDNPTYRCQNNWSLNASSCYLFSSNKLTWHEAGDYCRTQGASLLILNNAKEWVCISTQLYATLIQ